LFDRTENLPKLKRTEIRADARLPAKQVGDRLDRAKLVCLVAVKLESHRPALS
jgi:hypothetical protein